MPDLIIEAGTLAIAHDLYSGLSEFHPELGGDDRNGYRIRIEMGSEPQLVGVLRGIQKYVSARNEGSAGVAVGGRPYTFHVQ